MSAPSLRASSRPWKVARHYLGMLGSGGGAWGVGAGLVHALTGTMDGNESIAFRGVRTAAMLAFFLPLLHWRSSGHAGALDGAMPLGRARHDLIRIACGAVWACAAVLVVVGFFMLLAIHLVDYPWWYPLPTLLAGATMYLLGSAVWLRSEKPGRMLLLAFLLPFVAGTALRFILGPGRGGGTLTWAMAATGLRAEGVLLVPVHQWLAGAALWLAIACTAVGLSVTADRWLDPLGRAWAGSRWATPLRRLGRRGAPAAPLRAGRRGAAGERRPAPSGVVFARDVRLLRPRMMWPLCLLALWLCVKVSVTLDSSTTAEPAVFDPWGFSLLSMLAFLPLLLWRDGTGSRLLYDDSLPVDGAKLRTMRVAAGAVWVGAIALAAVLVLTAGGIAAGRVPSLQSVTPRVWVGVPGAALLLYLLGSVPVLVSSRHPLLATAAFWLSFEALARVDAPSGWDAWRFSPWAALSPIGRTSGPEVPWQTPLAIWLPLAALAVAGAAALGASIDRTSQNPHAEPVRTSPMAAGGAA